MLSMGTCKTFTARVLCFCHHGCVSTKNPDDEVIGGPAPEPPEFIALVSASDIHLYRHDLVRHMQWCLAGFLDNCSEIKMSIKYITYLRNLFVTKY